MRDYQKDDFDEKWKQMHTPCDTAYCYSWLSHHTGASGIKEFSWHQVSRGPMHTDMVRPSVAALAALVDHWNLLGGGEYEYRLLQKTEVPG